MLKNFVYIKMLPIFSKLILINETCPYQPGEYGKYSNKGEAEKHLRELGWVHMCHGQSDYWGARGMFGDISVTMTAEIKKMSYRQRNQLPRNKK